MTSKAYGIKLFLPLLGLIAGLPQSVMAAELSTLFTTAQERQIINNNRYKREKVTPPPAEVVEALPELSIQPVVREEVTLEYQISGITVSQDGAHSVWINSLIYDDGEQLDDSSRIKVLVEDEIKVRITAPDGKHYYGTSGQTLEITYLASVNE